jgi:hypothetical protein
MRFLAIRASVFGFEFRFPTPSFVEFDDVAVLEDFGSVHRLAVETLMPPEAGEFHGFGQLAMDLDLTERDPPPQGRLRSRRWLGGDGR